MKIRLSEFSELGPDPLENGGLYQFCVLKDGQLKSFYSEATWLEFSRTFWVNSPDCLIFGGDAWLKAKNLGLQVFYRKVGETAKKHLESDSIPQVHKSSYDYSDSQNSLLTDSLLIIMD